MKQSAEYECVIPHPDGWGLKRDRTASVSGGQWVMVTLETLQREKRTEIVRLGEKYGARNIRVFGSVVRGDNHAASDVDLLVDMDQDRTLFDLAGFVADVQDLLDAKVDVVTPGGLRYLRERVLSEAVPI
jgi:predicted nucleotidyltransferase